MGGNARCSGGTGRKEGPKLEKLSFFQETQGQICTPPNFGENPKFDYSPPPPMCILLKFESAKFGVFDVFFSKVIEEKPLGGVGLTSPPPW